MKIELNTKFQNVPNEIEQNGITESVKNKIDICLREYKVLRFVIYLDTNTSDIVEYICKEKVKMATEISIEIHICGKPPFTIDNIASMLDPDLNDTIIKEQ